MPAEGRQRHQAGGSGRSLSLAEGVGDRVEAREPAWRSDKEGSQALEGSVPEEWDNGSYMGTEEQHSGGGRGWAWTTPGRGSRSGHGRQEQQHLVGEQGAGAGEGQEQPWDAKEGGQNA